MTVIFVILAITLVVTIFDNIRISKNLSGAIREREDWKEIALKYQKVTHKALNELEKR